MMNIKYIETIKLPEPNWAALSSSIRRALSILEDKKISPKSVIAASESLSALELALTLNDGTTVEGVYKGLQFIPEGVLTEGDFIVSDGVQGVLITCEPWDPYWLENHTASRNYSGDDNLPVSEIEETDED